MGKVSKGLEENRWGDRWGLNPQPLEPQSSALPIELRSPCFGIVSIVDSLRIVNSGFHFFTCLNASLVTRGSLERA
jgi:hypothetical protein